MDSPLFSILIAQYNNGQYFEDCYNSIIAQTYLNWEVIIVDDGSEDDSVAQMKRFIGDDPRFKIFLNEENKGCGYTKRRCAEVATGEICAFLDPDDAITPDALELMVAEHAKHPEASMIYSKPFWCDEHLKSQYERNSKQIVNGVVDFFDFEGYVFHLVSFKKKLYDQTPGLNSYLHRAVDKDLFFLLYEVGDCIFVDKALYKYRVHGKCISLSGNEDKAFFWYWVTVIDAAKRRNVNIENLFVEKALTSRREYYLQKEIDSYNKSIIFKGLRKLGVFKI